MNGIAFVVIVSRGCEHVQHCRVVVATKFKVKEPNVR
jgi:hypothetical protein